MIDNIPTSNQQKFNQPPNIKIYTQPQICHSWLTKYTGIKPAFVCVLGFTATARIEGISAAGKTPRDREFTACADAEFLHYGINHNFKYKLPPLTAGASPVFITRAVTEGLDIPVSIFNAGLSVTNPFTEVIDLQGSPAKCLTTGKAIALAMVRHLFTQGREWGEKLAQELQQQKSYLVLSECVVAGTTTALAVLTGLGIHATGKVNSSHPECNHGQKWQVVQQGLAHLVSGKLSTKSNQLHPLEIVAALGDPMQIVVAGMAIAVSNHCGVLLAGGTQMLAVYALACAIANAENLPWEAENIVVGTTRWVAEDPTGATVELAQTIGKANSFTPTPPLIATQLDFSHSRFPQLQAYERGFVKEGVGAGGIAIASHLYANWSNSQLVEAVEKQLELYQTQQKS